MKQHQQSTAATLRRAQQFMDTHADVVGAINQTDARKQLDQALGLLDTSSVEQETRRRTARGETHGLHALQRTLIGSHVVPMTKFARARLAGVPTIAALTPSVRHLNGASLAKAARALAAAAAPFAPQFVAAKFPADFLAQLDVVAAAIVTAHDARASTAVRRTGATKQIKTALAAGRAAVAVLDATLTRLLASDTRLAQEWRTAKRIKAKPGPTAIVALTTQPAGEEVTKEA